MHLVRMHSPGGVKLDEINENECVGDEQGHPDPGEPPGHFKDFPRQKRCRYEQGEKLAPGLFEVEANSLGQAQASIAEGHCPDTSQHRIVEKRSLIQNKVDESRLGIEA